MTPPKCRRSAFLALCTLVLFPGVLRAADDQPPGEGPIPRPAQSALAEIRRITGCQTSPIDEAVRELTHRGRPSIEIKGRERGGEADGTMRDLAVFDPAAGWIVSYACFANASTRKGGEAILSLVEVSSGGDKFARAILPGRNLELEGIKRYLSGGDSVYYDARYASSSGPFPFLEPPVRLLLNASTGSLFRLEIDPDWLDPVAPPRARISKHAAERIATVILRGLDLAPGFGPGAVFSSVAAAELFTVYPNDWLGFPRHYPETRARVAWVVPFRVGGGAAPGVHNLFVDAATGTVLGGVPGQSGGQPQP